MKLLLVFFAFLSFVSDPPKWLTDFDLAKKEAVKSDEFILISFSGSDWCIPCIKMEKEFFENEKFSNYAAKNLVMVKADFPRLKKNNLPKEQTAQNEHLAEQYNPHGSFPYTVLVNKDGKIIKQWEGLPSKNAEAFVAEINAIIHAGN